MNSLVLDRKIPKIDKFPIAEIRSTIGKLAEAIQIITEANEKGGSLRLFQAGDAGSFDQIFFDIFGVFPPENRRNLEIRSKEQAIRLQSHPKHHSSFESRNEEKDYYGGAIRTGNNFIISCSGMSEEENEALSLCLAMHLGWLNKNNSNQIAKKSDNKIFHQLIKTMGY